MPVDCSLVRDESAPFDPRMLAGLMGRLEWDAMRTVGGEVRVSF